LAYHIFITPANSVPSERAFSYSLQHDKKRSKLTTQNTDQLYFNVNRGVLDRTLTCKKRWEQLDEEKLACIEEKLLGTAEDPCELMNWVPVAVLVVQITTRSLCRICCGPGVGVEPGDPRSGLCGPVGLR